MQEAAADGPTGGTGATHHETPVDLERIGILHGEREREGHRPRDPRKTGGFSESVFFFERKCGVRCIEVLMHVGPKSKPL